MKPIIAITPSTDGRKYMLSGAYCRAVKAAGGVPIILPYEDIDTCLAAAQGLILSGGGDISAKYLAEPLHPKASYIFEERDDFELELCKRALALDMPLLGICRGMQIINVAAGGSIIQHIEDHSFPERRQETVHDAAVSRGSILYDILKMEAISVNSVHHQAVSLLGDGVAETVTAGDNVPEGIELPRLRFALGVQWHPEAIYETHTENLGLFFALVNAARSYKGY